MEELFLHVHESLGRIDQKVEPRIARKVVKRARREIESITLERQQSTEVAKFDIEEITGGFLLGTGGFSTVLEVHSITPLSSRLFSQEEERKRKKIIEESETSTPLAVKILREDVINNTKKFYLAAVDLVKEAELLRCLDHPNIIKLRGIAADGVEGFSSGRTDGFFIVLDRLNETLKERIAEWSKRFKRLHRPFTKNLIDRKGKKGEQLLREKLQVALDIANAMRYLHGKNLIFRDLKPSNIGFDLDGVVKLFDFGLCREVPRQGCEDSFRMTGGAGTRWYMAPEVHDRKHYGQEADVYSFGTVLFEVLAMESMSSLKPSSDSRTVPYQTRVENISPVWPQAIQQLLQKTWSLETAERPSMDEICTILETQLAEPMREKAVSVQKNNGVSRANVFRGQTMDDRTEYSRFSWRTLSQSR